MRRKTRVKFCGLRRQQDVQAALQLGVDYIGFVLVPGTRRSVSEDDVQRILQQVDCSAVCRVGVFRNQPLEVVNRLVESLSLDLVQLHGSEDAAYARQIQTAVIQVVPVAVQGSVALETPTKPPIVPTMANRYAVLLDASPGQGRSGGLGLLADPREMHRARQAVPEAIRVFLAGGLTPQNVRNMVEQVRPDAVDVSSGIEQAPGIKDPQKMRAFVDALQEEA